MWLVSCIEVAGVGGVWCPALKWREGVAGVLHLSGRGVAGGVAVGLIKCGWLGDWALEDNKE